MGRHRFPSMPRVATTNTSLYVDSCHLFLKFCRLLGTLLRSFLLDIFVIILSVNMPAERSSQLSRHSFSTSAHACSVSCNVWRNTIVVLFRGAVRGLVTQSTTAAMTASTSSENILKRPAVASGSTTESSLFKRVCAAQPAITVFFSHNDAAVTFRLLQSL